MIIYELSIWFQIQKINSISVMAIQRYKRIWSELTAVAHGRLFTKYQYSLIKRPGYNNRMFMGVTTTKYFKDESHGTKHYE